MLRPLHRRACHEGKTHADLPAPGNEGNDTQEQQGCMGGGKHHGLRGGAPPGGDAAQVGAAGVRQRAPPPPPLPLLPTKNAVLL